MYACLAILQARTKIWTKVIKGSAGRAKLLFLATKCANMCQDDTKIFSYLEIRHSSQSRDRISRKRAVTYLIFLQYHTKLKLLV